MNIINLTPHTIRLNDGREFPPSGTIARVAVTHAPIENIDGIPLTKTVYGDVVGLPAEQAGVLLIVSGAVAAAAPQRHDLVAPATGHPETIRKDGQVVSVPALTWNNRS